MTGGEFSMNTLDAVIETLIHIEWHLKETIDIRNISNESGYTIEQLKSVFNKQTGYGMEEYIEKRRFTEIVKRLVQTNDEVADIAEDFSFSNSSVLALFLQKYNVNPFNIRKGHAVEEFLLTESIVDVMIKLIAIGTDSTGYPAAKQKAMK
jgi:AraC-like DNA-binding protein